jgi:hypothetical protein
VARRRISGALALVAIGLAGCGSGHKLSADEQAAATTLRGYLTAFAHHDYTGACARLTHDAKVKIARRSRAPTLHLNRAGCPAQLAALLGKVPSDQRAAVLGVVANAKVDSVKIADDSATATVRATFRGHSQSQPVTLRREGNGWKVDATPNAKQD